MDTSPGDNGPPVTTVYGDRLARVTAVMEDGVTVVRLEGEIDVANVAGVADDVRCAAADAEAVVVDLTDLRYAGSAALRMLEAEGSALVGRGARYLLLAPAGAPSGRLLGIVGLDRKFPVVATVDEARRSMAG